MIYLIMCSKCAGNRRNWVSVKWVQCRLYFGLIPGRRLECWKDFPKFGFRGQTLHSHIYLRKTCLKDSIRRSFLSPKVTFVLCFCTCAVKDLKDGLLTGWPALSILNIPGSKMGNRRTANVRSVGYSGQVNTNTLIITLYCRRLSVRNEIL